MIDIWETLESAFPAIVGNLRAADKDLPGHPVQQVEGWARLMDFLLFEGKAINGKIVTENLQRRAYMNPDAIDNSFEALTKENFAIKNEDGTFNVTGAGSAIYTDYFLARMLAYDAITLLSDDDFTVFIDFLKKGYEAAKTTPQPGHKPGMSIGYNFYTNITGVGGQLGTMLGWINLAEMYRDDVHAYVWKKAGFTGIQIESLTNIWRDEVYNAKELAEQLSFRGYVEEDYQQALDELAAKDILSVNDNHYTLTENGLTRRKQVENETNQIYDAFCAATYSEQEIAEFARVIEVIKSE